MVTLEDARQMVSRWAARQSTERRHEVVPMVHEFDLGFVMWTKEPPSVLPEPGHGARTVVDRRTGVLSYWPSLPIEMIVDAYRRQVAEARPTVATIDGVAQFRRDSRRVPAPTTAAHLTLAADRRLRRAFGAKGDQELNHHPLVGEWIADLPAGQAVRGAERHPELIAISDALHEHDAAGEIRADLDAARALFAAAALEVFPVRETGDERVTRPAYSCATCAQVRWYLGIGRDDAPPHAPVPPVFHLGRPLALDGMAPQVRALLAEGEVAVGSQRDGSPDERAARLGDDLAALGGHDLFPAGRDALLRYGGLRSRTQGPGAALWIGPFDIGIRVPPCPQALAGFAEVIGARLYPIGAEHTTDAVLAVDEHGRMFALDQGGEWFLGGSVDDAVVTLARGRAQPRVRDDGTW